MGQTVTHAHAGHPFHTPQWQQIWWSHFGSGRLLSVSLGDVGTVQVALGDDGVARFPGDTATTDYPGPAIEAGGTGAAMAALLAGLRADPSAPRRLIARDQPADVAAALAGAAAEAGLACVVDDDEPVALLSLPGSGDAEERIAAWRAGLSRHARHELARKQRRLQRAFPDARVRTGTAATLPADLDAYCALHRRSPDGDKAGYLTAQREAFVRDVVATFVDAGLSLDVLDDGAGRPLAITLAFTGPTTFFLYNMAFDPDASDASPGIGLVAALVERPIAAGATTFDFLRGLERYKLELGARPVWLRRVEVTLR